MIKPTDATPVIKLALSSHWSVTRLAIIAAATTLHNSTSVTLDAGMPALCVALPGVLIVPGASFTVSLALYS
jgi:hypothetical protein